MKTINFFKYMKTFPYTAFYKKCLYLIISPRLHLLLLIKGISIKDAVDMDIFLKQGEHTKIQKSLIIKLEDYKTLIGYNK